MVTRRCLEARASARAALEFRPTGNPPGAFRELVDAVATDFHDGCTERAFLSLLDERDADFEGLLLLAAGVNVADRAPPVKLGDLHVMTMIDGIMQRGRVTPGDLARYVDLHAAVHFRRDRRAAVRDLVWRNDDCFCECLRQITRLEL